MSLEHWSQTHDDTLEEFENYLIILGRRPCTISVYVGCARNFLRHVKKGIDDLESDDVFKYFVDLKKQQHLSNATLNQKRAVLQVLFRDILGRPLPKRLLKYAKLAKRLPETLTDMEVTSLFQATENVKYLTIMMTMYSAGLRVS